MKHVGKIITWLGIAVYAVCAALIIVTLMPVGGWKALDVLTGSMRPTIQPGDLVIIHKVPLADINPGNIVTYTNPNNPAETITHRVVSKQLKNGLLMVTTKGDANPAADPPFAGGHIVGRVSKIVPFAGKAINTLHNKFALIALVVIPGLVVIWAEIERLRKALAKPKTLNEQNTTENNQPPPPPAPPEPQVRPEPRKQSEKRRLDGMGPHTFAILLMIMLASLCVGVTRAAQTTNAVTAISKVNVASSTPPNQFPCPPGFVIVSQTAAGSLTTFKCRSTQFTHNITVNITILTNSSDQSSTTGNVAGGGNSGNSSNSNNTSNTVTNNNPTPTPSPTPSAVPSPSPQVH